MNRVSVSTIVLLSFSFLPLLLSEGVPVQGKHVTSDEVNMMRSSLPVTHTDTLSDSEDLGRFSSYSTSSDSESELNSFSNWTGEPQPPSAPKAGGSTTSATSTTTGSSASGEGASGKSGEGNKRGKKKGPYRRSTIPRFGESSEYDGDRI